MVVVTNFLAKLKCSECTDCTVLECYFNEIVQSATELCMAFDLSLI